MRNCILTIVCVSQQGLLSELTRLLKEEKQESLRLFFAEIAGELGGMLESSDWPSLAVATVTLCKVSCCFVVKSPYCRCSYISAWIIINAE